MQNTVESFRHRLKKRGFNIRKSAAQEDKGFYKIISVETGEAVAGEEYGMCVFTLEDLKKWMVENRI